MNLKINKMQKQLKQLINKTSNKYSLNILYSIEKLQSDLKLLKAAELKEIKRREKSLEANVGIWTKEFITNKIK